MNVPLIPLAVLVSALVFTQSRAEVVKAADLRLPARAFPDAFTRFDPGFGPFPVRAVAGAPAPIPITFSGTTQRADDGINENDIALRTYESATMVQQLSRYLADEKDKFRRVGTLSWHIDLHPLASHLASTRQRPVRLEIRLVEGDPGNGDGYVYDVYLSPAGLGPASAPAVVDPKNPEENYRALWLPAQERNDGDVFPYVAENEEYGPDSVGRRVLIVRRNKSTTALETIIVDLLPQYLAGAREFTLLLAGGSYGKSRNIKIQEGSGLFFSTVSTR